MKAAAVCFCKLFFNGFLKQWEHCCDFRGEQDDLQRSKLVTAAITVLEPHRSISWLILLADIKVTSVFSVHVVRYVLKKLFLMQYDAGKVAGELVTDLARFLRPVFKIR